MGELEIAEQIQINFGHLYELIAICRDYNFTAYFITNFSSLCSQNDGKSTSLFFFTDKKNKRLYSLRVSSFTFYKVARNVESPSMQNKVFQNEVDKFWNFGAPSTFEIFYRWYFLLHLKVVFVNIQSNCSFGLVQ